MIVIIMLIFNDKKRIDDKICLVKVNVIGSFVMEYVNLTTIEKMLESGD